MTVSFGWPSAKYIPPYFTCLFFACSIIQWALHFMDIWNHP